MIDADVTMEDVAEQARQARQAANTAQIRGGDFATIPVHTTGFGGLAGVTAGGGIQLPDTTETYPWGATTTTQGHWGTPAPAPTADMHDRYTGGYAEAANHAEPARHCSTNSHRFACDHETTCYCGTCSRTPPAMWAVPRGL